MPAPPPNGQRPPNRPHPTSKSHPQHHPNSRIYPTPQQYVQQPPHPNGPAGHYPAQNPAAGSPQLPAMNRPLQQQQPAHGVSSMPPSSGGVGAHSHSPRNLNSSGKRKAIEVVTLSDSDSDFPVVSPCHKSSRKQPKLVKISTPAPKSARSVNSSAGSSRTSDPSSQPPVITIDSDDEYGDWDSEDEAEAQKLVEQSQQERDGEGLEHYGSMAGKIVGIRYYNGIATVGEQVLFRREPGNQYDRNAIRVDNVNHIQIGHIPRQMAAKLSPILDSGTIHLEGTVSDPAGTYELPITLEIYGPVKEPFKSQAKAAVTRQKLTLRQSAEQRRREQQERQRKASEDRRRAQEAKNRATVHERRSAASTGSGWVEDVVEFAGDFMLSSLPQTPDWADLVGDSEVFNPRELGAVVQKFGIGEADLEKMVKAKQPARLKTELLPYQLQGLGWLLQKEHPQLPTTEDIVQLWQKVPGIQTRYQNIATLYTTTTPPELYSGGILADDMGLGKTLQIISLIVTDVTQERELVPQAKVGLGKSTAGTLIVAPVSVMSNWTGQMEHHISKENPLKVFTYHGTNRSNVNLSEYDIVITSYGTLTSEFNPKRPGPSATGIYSYKWRRIVLDEAHQIRNPKSKASLAATNLNAESRWCLTGTPIINTLKDLYSLVRFVRFSGGLSEFDIFNRVMIRPLNRAVPEADKRLQALMASVCLRRTKDMKFVELGLPRLSEYVHKVKWLSGEREKYDALVKEAKGLLDRYSAANSAGSAAGSTEYRFILEILLRMRQMCNHSSLCGERLEALMKLANKDRVELTEENKALLQEVLQMAIEAQEDCSVCLETLHNPRITVCKHVFGLECIEKVIELQHKCPMCRAELKDPSSTLVEPVTTSLTQETEETRAAVENSDSSSKIDALLKILQASHAKDSTTKTIVFSQWTRFLSLLELQFSRYSIPFARIDGTMTIRQRDIALQTFTNDPDCKVLLASLSVASVGINLIAANQVVLSDSWWAPAIEDQAVDRVYRLGQKRETTVFRLVMEDSIEERVLKVQENKRNLVGTAWGVAEKKGRREAREARWGELVALLGTGPAPQQGQAEALAQAM